MLIHLSAQAFLLRFIFPNASLSESEDHFASPLFTTEAKVQTLCVVRQFFQVGASPQLSGNLNIGSGWSIPVAMWCFCSVASLIRASFRHLQSCTCGPDILQTVSDLWIVPIFLDFCRLLGRATGGLSACDSADCPVLRFVGMGVAKRDRVSVPRKFSFLWNSPDAARIVRTLREGFES